MKRFVLSFLMIFSIGYGYSQNTDSLIGLYWNGSVEISTHVKLQAQTYHDADTIHGLQSLFLGEHCFDPINRRLFIRGSSGINVIDAGTGELLDTFGSAWPIAEIEYDPTVNRLVGLVYTNPEWTFVSIDVSTPALVYHDTLADVNTLNGGATFDPLSRSYILKTNLGFTLVNAQTGAIIDTIADPHNMNSIEFNPTSGKIVGTYFDQGNQQLYYADLNPLTKMYTTLAPVNGIWGITGISSFDVSGQRYINLTTSGITTINANTGALLDTFPNTPNLVAFEYINPMIPTSLQKWHTQKDISVYPNPAREQISLAGADESGSYRIFDLTGRELAHGDWQSLSPTIDISQLPQGMYWIFVDGGKAVPFVKE